MGCLFVFCFLFFREKKTRRKLRWFVSQENLFFLQLLLHETARKQALSPVANGSPSPLICIHRLKKSWLMQLHNCALEKLRDQERQKRIHKPQMDESRNKLGILQPPGSSRTALESPASQVRCNLDSVCGGGQPGAITTFPYWRTTPSMVPTQALLASQVISSSTADTLSCLQCLRR